MGKSKVSIHENDAHIYYDFSFRLDEEVVIDAGGTKGIVEDAIWEGNKDTAATFYTVTYFLRTQ